MGMIVVNFAANSEVLFEIH